MARISSNTVKKPQVKIVDNQTLKQGRTIKAVNQPHKRITKSRPQQTKIIRSSKSLNKNLNKQLVKHNDENPKYNIHKDASSQKPLSGYAIILPFFALFITLFVVAFLNIGADIYSVKQSSKTKDLDKLEQEISQIKVSTKSVTNLFDTAHKHGAKNADDFFTLTLKTNRLDHQLNDYEQSIKKEKEHTN